MYLILLKDRSSWLRFLSWSKASLGTSFNEFRATFSRRRSLGKFWWGRTTRRLKYQWLQQTIGPTDASTIFWRGTAHPSWSQLGRAGLTQRKTSKAFLDWQTQPWIGPSSFFIVAFNTDHAKTISNAKRSWNKKYIFSFSFVAVVCPFGTFGDHISV